jgi:hypothetical protein
MGLRIEITLRLEVSAQLLRRQRIGLRIYIDEIGMRSCLRNGLGRRDKGEGYSHNDVARASANSHQGKSQGVSSAANSHALLRSTIGSECALKLFHCRATDKPSGRKGRFENIHQFGLDLLVQSNQIYEGNLAVSVMTHLCLSSRFKVTCYRAQHLGWVSGDNDIRGHIARHHAARPNNGILSHGHL